jgi:hypothetical protein
VGVGIGVVRVFFFIFRPFVELLCSELSFCSEGRGAPEELDQDCRKIKS